LYSHDLEVLNLQRTLDQREHEIDSLEEAHAKLQGHVTMQKVEVEKLRREVRAGRELAIKITAMEAEIKVY